MQAAAKLTNFPRFLPETNSCGVYCTYPPTPSASATWQTGLSTVYVVRPYKDRRMAVRCWTETSVLVSWLFHRTCWVLNILINCIKKGQWKWPLRVFARVDGWNNKIKRLLNRTCPAHNEGTLSDLTVEQMNKYYSKANYHWSLL